MDTPVVLVARICDPAAAHRPGPPAPARGPAAGRRRDRRHRLGAVATHVHHTQDVIDGLGAELTAGAAGTWATPPVLTHLRRHRAVPDPRGHTTADRAGQG